MGKSSIRFDLKIIADEVAPNSKVLDVGCGDGELLHYLKKSKKIDARGLEISTENAGLAVAKGLSVVQGDANIDLSDYPEKSFDYVILSDTLQSVANPSKTLNELVRIGKKVIVSIPNFGYWYARFYLLLKGEMPMTKALPYSWYDTPNIHLCTLRDFDKLCKKLDVKVDKRILLNSKGRIKKGLFYRPIENLFTQQAFYILEKN